ncbi:hypothetical protein BIBE0010001c01_00045 [Bifidobacterium phage BigBern1]|nr:hypothetical protein BIBE0010001c01_00045 [Bifidobacterium phage BigBern1]
MSLYAILYANGEETILHGSDIVDEGCVYLDKDGIEGWLSTPDLKTQPVERSWGNGAHDVPEADITYSARTLTIHIDLVSTGRASLLALARTVSASTGRLVRFRVVDEGQDTYVDGYVRPEYGSNWFQQIMTGALTMVCPRPERLSWRSMDVQLFPTASLSGGLSYGDKGLGLTYPLSYGADAGSPQSVALLRNAGSATAYPVITVTGPMPDGVLLAGSDGRALQWSGSVGRVPLILDCRTQTASMGGVDVSRLLTRRGFPAIPAMGSLSVQLLSPGSGWATVSVRDTYL